MNRKIVFHIDVNSAFLSWTALQRMRVLGEELDLRTVPAVVGGDEEARHGIVLAKSTPAKKYGIQTAEPIASARRKCPSLLVVSPDFSWYVKQSELLLALLRRHSDHVIPYSIDEAWAEFDGFEAVEGDPEQYANALREEVKRELGFTVNIGVSTNRLLSKMAGDFRKPDLVHTLFPEEIEKKMWPLPVGTMLFVGKSAQDRLKRLGIFTIGDLAAADPAMLRAHLKKHGEAIWNYAWGREGDLFAEQEEAKGYGNSVTTSSDVEDWETARQILLSLCETVGMRLRNHKVKISCISVGIRTASFENSSRQMQLDSATDVTEEIFQAACQLLEKVWEGRKPLRLLSVSTTRITHEEYRQFRLFEEKNYEKLEKANQAIDSIRKKFGEDAVMRASFLKSDISHTGRGLNQAKRNRGEE